MRKLAYILLAVSLILAGMTLMKTNLLASDGKKMQETLTQLRQSEEEVGRLAEEVARAKSVTTVVERAEELGFGGATVAPALRLLAPVAYSHASQERECGVRACQRIFQEKNPGPSERD